MEPLYKEFLNLQAKIDLQFLYLIFQPSYTNLSKPNAVFFNNGKKVTCFNLIYTEK